MMQDKEKPTIVHIDLTCSFSEGFSYQENILPKYHVRMGYEVHFITHSHVILGQYVLLIAKTLRE